MPDTMAFDQKHLPPELLFKLEEAKADERRNLEPTDAANPFPSPPMPEFSPVKEVVEEMMAHWAADSDTDSLLVNGKDQRDRNEDLEDKTTTKTGITADFDPDSAGQTHEPGEPDVKPIGGTALGGGGGGGDGDGASAGDDWDINLWRRRRSSGVLEDDVPADEEEAPVVDETSEEETTQK